MSYVLSGRRHRLVKLLGVASAAAMIVAMAPPTVAHAAAIVGTITVSPTTGKIAAATGKQVVSLTVAGAAVPALSEANVSGVTLGTCTNLQTYVVTSTTSISVKTPSPAGCTASSGGTAEDIIIIFANGDTLTKTGGITFVPPPLIDAVANKPVITNNSTELAAGQKVQRFVSTGGQVVRVYADSTFAFDPRTAAGLAASMSGKAGTDIKVYDPSGVQIPANTSSGPAAGNSMSFKTATGMSTSDATITLTQSGVSKTFTTTDTNISVVTLPVITGLTTTSGKTGAANTVVINGTGFDKVAANYGSTTKVTFCGVEATFPSSGQVNAAGTQITAITPTAIANVAPGLGTGNYAGSCAVRVGDGTGTGDSLVTADSTFTFVKE